MKHVDVMLFLLPGIYKISCPKIFYKKGVLKIFIKFTGKDLCQTQLH